MAYLLETAFGGMLSWFRFLTVNGLFRKPDVLTGELKKVVLRIAFL